MSSYLGRLTEELASGVEAGVITQAQSRRLLTIPLWSAAGCGPRPRSMKSPMARPSIFLIRSPSRAHTTSSSPECQRIGATTRSRLTTSRGRPAWSHRGSRRLHACRVVSPGRSQCKAAGAAGAAQGDGGCWQGRPEGGKE